jgi:hypothetical protein
MPWFRDLRFWLSRLLAFLCLLTCTFALGFRLQKKIVDVSTHALYRSFLYDRLWPGPTLFSLRLSLALSWVRGGALASLCVIFSPPGSDLFLQLFGHLCLRSTFSLRPSLGPAFFSASFSVLADFVLSPLAAFVPLSLRFWHPFLLAFGHSSFSLLAPFHASLALASSSADWGSWQLGRENFSLLSA